jgi:hypothetical protein
MDDFAVENLRIVETPTITKAKAAARRRQEQQFIMVPLWWQGRLGRAAHACTFKVALEILYRNWRSGGKPVLLPNVGLGVSGKSKWRGLRELEDLGLVAIKCRPRKSPLVAVILKRPGGRR